MCYNFAGAHTFSGACRATLTNSLGGARRLPSSHQPIMMKICILAACVAATMGVSHEATPTEAPAMTEAPAISMNDGDVDMFSPKTVSPPLRP